MFCHVLMFLCCTTVPSCQLDFVFKLIAAAKFPIGVNKINLTLSNLSIISGYSSVHLFKYCIVGFKNNRVHK